MEFTMLGRCQYEYIHIKLEISRGWNPHRWALSGKTYRMTMVEYLTDSADKLEEKWAVSVDKLWRGKDN